VVKPIISDDHKDLKAALSAGPQGVSWQRCRTHSASDLLTRAPEGAQDLEAALVSTIYARPNAAEVSAQRGRAVEELEERLTEAAATLVEAADDILAFTAFPEAG